MRSKKTVLEKERSKETWEKESRQETLLSK